MCSGGEKHRTRGIINWINPLEIADLRQGIEVRYGEDTRNYSQAISLDQEIPEDEGLEKLRISHQSGCGLL